MIPAPNLDDRTFEDLVQEAITLIPKYCPGWTNHNPTDPGITLIELYAWMAEMVIYRLNKVTDKNYLAFLDLMGISLQPAAPARALLRFQLAEKATGQRVEAGTQVATPQTGTQEAILFETERDLLVSPMKVERCFSQFHGQYTEHTEELEAQGGDGFLVFQGQKSVERVLYLGDERFANLNDAAMLRLNFTAPEAVGTDFPRFLEWQYWNGRRWKELMTSAMEFSRGEIVFDQIEGIEPCAVGGVEQHWIRGVLVEVPHSEQSTLLETVRAQVEVLGEGIGPDVVLTNDDMDNMLARDLSKNFAVFGDNPKADCILYLASHDFFSQAGADLRIEFRVSDPTVKEPPKPGPELVIAWEYFDGKAWRQMARATPSGLEESVQGMKFEDGTLAFSQSGSVGFRRPEDMAETEVFGQPSFWVRARIVQGNYGMPGQYELDGDRWVWHDENPLRPPYVKAVRLNYSEPSKPLGHVLSYNDFHYTDHTEQAKQAGRSFQPFQPISEESPTLYLGFDKPFPNESMPLYFNVVERSGQTELQREFKEYLQRHFADARSESREQRIVWEYSRTEGDWAALAVSDQTQNFTQSGFIDLIGPKDFGRSRKFGHHLHWLRARLEMGGFIDPPRINYVGLNCVYALNHQTLYDEVLGSSEGTPNQRFEFNYRPVLAGEQLWVRERERPTERELFDLREELGKGDASLSDVLREPTDGRGGAWVRWLPVESFYASGQRSRHYKKEPILGEVQFGDGIKGMVPPIGESNLVARLYRVGGGARGNVGSGTITTLKRAISYIDTVTNPFAASGGSDQETVEAVKERGPYVIRSNYRAVTKDDFEWLAQQASNSVARAMCLPSTEREGEVKVVIIPKFDELGSDYREKLLPSTELLRQVRNYLDERRLVTTLVNVARPRYVDITVRVDVIRAPTGSADKVKREIEKALRVFLHPLRGGRNGKGWAFGRNVLKMDLYHVIEEVAGVERVDKIQIVDEDQRHIAVDQIKIGLDALPYLVDVEVTEKSREKLL